jgi:hypothetical protein
MTNKEKLIQMLQDRPLDAVSFMESMVKHPLYPYLDTESFLESENSDIVAFAKHKGYCYLMPSDMSVIACKNEHGKHIKQNDIDKYIDDNKKKAILLDDISMLGQTYMCLYLLEEKQIIKVPDHHVEMIAD